MKRENVVPFLFAAMAATILVVTISGCRKDSSEPSLSPTEIVTINSMRSAYVDAKAYNDSVIMSSKDSLWNGTPYPYFDHRYHQQDSVFNYYNNLCHQEMRNHCSSNLMNGGMMSGGTMGGNNNHANCQINTVDCLNEMNMLRQQHALYHH